MSRLGLCFEEVTGVRQRKQARMVLGVFNVLDEQRYTGVCTGIHAYVNICVYICI